MYVDPDQQRIAWLLRELDERDRRNRIHQWLAVGVVVSVVLLTRYAQGSPAAAAQAALLDAAAMQAAGHDTGGYLYVWSIDGGYRTEERARLAAFAGNLTLSDKRAALIVYPRVLSDSLIRVELDRYAAGSPEATVRLRTVRDTIQDDRLYRRRLVTVEPYRASDGQTYTQRRVVTAVDASIAELGKIIPAGVPLVTYEAFLNATLFAADEGRYYEFLGIERQRRDEYLAGVGSDLPAIRDEFESNVRALLALSDVTDRSRVIEALPGIGSRPSANQGITYITEDYEKASRKSPLDSLLVGDFDGQEGITEAANGRSIYTLWDADGGLVRSAPDTLATSDAFTPPHDQRLIPPFSCLVCHTKEGSLGFRSIRNDWQAMTAGLDIVAMANGSPIERLAKAFEWTPDKVLDRSRIDFSEFIIRGTGGWAVERWREELLADVFRARISHVDAERAAVELGLSVEQFAAVRHPDPMLSLLQAGRKISLPDWRRVYYDIWSMRK